MSSFPSAFITAKLNRPTKRHFLLHLLRNFITSLSMFLPPRLLRRGGGNSPPSVSPSSSATDPVVSSAVRCGTFLAALGRSLVHHFRRLSGRFNSRRRRQGARSMTSRADDVIPDIFARRPMSYIFYGVSELGRRKLSPTSATAHYSSPDNAIGLVAQCDLSEYVKLG